MLANNWEAARCVVSAAAEGDQRQALARALIPAALDAYAFGVAQALIEENDLKSEFPAVSRWEKMRFGLEAGGGVYGGRWGSGAAVSHLRCLGNVRRL